MKNITQILRIMLSRYNRKQELHQRAHSYYKNFDVKVFTVPLMTIQLIMAVLPQLAQIFPKHKKLVNIFVSSLAAISAIWMGFEAKENYPERVECHKNAAAIYQHLIVLTMVEDQKLSMTGEYNLEEFFQFQDMGWNLEGKAKDDECLVPLDIVKARRLEVEFKKRGNGTKAEVELNQVGLPVNSRKRRMDSS